MVAVGESVGEVADEWCVADVGASVCTLEAADAPVVVGREAVGEVVGGH